MTKPPEVVLCEIGNDEPSAKIATYLYDVEAQVINADNIPLKPGEEVASTKCCHFDSAGNLVSSGEEEASNPGDRYKFTGGE